MSVYTYQAEESVAGDQALFFRATDRLRLDGYVAALTQNGMSLSMVSDHDVILDHYGKLLVARLREVAPQIEIEVCFPANAEALISRFNDVLKTYSIQEAMDTQVPSAPPKIWMVHDASALPDHEIQLLARLVQNFPGANIRVIMLMTQASQKQKLLSIFGRRILNWDIEAPNSEQRAALLDQAREQGRENLVNALLMQLTPPPISVSAPLAAQALSKAQDKPLLKSKKFGIGQGNKITWMASSLLLLIACGVSVGLWYTGFSIPLLAVVPAMNKPVLADSQAAIAPPQEISNQLAQEVAKDIEEIIVTPAQAQAGQSWLLKMAATTFVVIHSTASSHQETSLWLQNQPKLKLAQIVAHTLPNQTGLQFSVISAPFTSSTEARGFADGPGMPRDASVHSAQFIKEQFPSAPKNLISPQPERKQ